MGHNRQNVRTPWLYKGHEGMLTGREGNSLCMPTFTKGDVIAALLDCDEGTLSFSKNGGAFILAFKALPVGSPIYPCYWFNSNRGNEKVVDCKIKIEELVLDLGDLSFSCKSWR